MSAAATAVSELRTRILAGSLPSGTKLYQDRIARELGMSRIPIRDALRQLASEGLVQLHNRTAVVAGIGIDDLSELYEIRLGIEPAASAAATARISEGELDRMRRLLTAMEQSNDNETWLQHHDEFHAVLYQASARPRMMAILDQARAQTRRYTQIRLDRGIADLNLEHRMILGAVERGESRTVRRLLEAHLTSAWEIVERHLAGRGSPAETAEIRARRRAWRRGSSRTGVEAEEVVA